MTAKTAQGLTDRQETFAKHVAAGRSLSDAYRAAYGASKTWKPESLYTRASVVARLDHVSQRIADLRNKVAEKFIFDESEILREMHRLAMSSPKGVYKEDGTVKLPHELDDATAASIKKFEIDDLGRIRYEFHDKRGALEMVAKHLGLFEKDNAQKPPALNVTRIELIALTPASPTKGIEHDKPQDYTDV